MSCESFQESLDSVAVDSHFRTVGLSVPVAGTTHITAGMECASRSLKFPTLTIKTLAILFLCLCV